MPPIGSQKHDGVGAKRLLIRGLNRLDQATKASVVNRTAIDKHHRIERIGDSVCCFIGPLRNFYHFANAPELPLSLSQSDVLD